MDSSEQQWKSFKSEEGIEEELAQNTKDGYLGKVAFLSRGIYNSKLFLKYELILSN